MSLVKAIYKGKVIAESHHTIMVEGNPYFPKTDINFSFLDLTETATVCPWKGEARYYSVKVDDHIAKDGCWFYPHPTDEAQMLRDHYAFWGDVEIVRYSEQERIENICSSTTQFIKGIEENTTGLDHRCPLVKDELKKFFSNLSDESITYALPQSYLDDLAFFNYYNSTNPCFTTNHRKEIALTNPTFNWAFSHFGEMKGRSLEDFFNLFEFPDDSKSQFLKTLDSHGWINIPKVRVVKEEEVKFYSIILVAIQHGERENLRGVQGQFLDITKEVQLAESVEDLLHNAGQGFLSFGEDYKIQKKYSQVCKTFFGKAIDDLDILELLNNGDEVGVRAQRGLLDLVFDETTELEMIEELLLKEIQVDSRILNIEYRWIEPTEAHLKSRLMLILSDITQEKELEKTLEEEKKKHSSIIKVVSNRSRYLDMIEELSTIFENINHSLDNFSSQDDVNYLFRQVHTVKGGCAVYGFDDVVGMAHELEGGLNDCKEKNSSDLAQQVDSFKGKMEKLIASYESTVKEMNGLLGVDSSSEKVYSITESQLDRLVKLLGEGSHPVAEELENLKKQSVSSILKEFEFTALGLAEKLGKKVEIQTSSDDVSIAKDKIQPALTPLIHIVRNSVDHGIEKSEERLAYGKDEVGHLHLKAYEREKTLCLEFSDDGKGIDLQKIKNLAIEKELISSQWAEAASEDDLAQLIFLPGLSSKEDVSDISGRGIGMDAVKTAIEDLGGKIDIETQQGQGTTFRISVPNVL